MRRFLAFAGDAPLAAHNARFDVGFLDRAVARSHRQARRRAGRRHRVARAEAAASPERALLAEPARALLRHVVRPLPSRAARCARDGRDPRGAPRARAGARRPDARRGDRARGASRTEAPRAALADRRRADDARRLPLPRPERHRAVRREGARPPGSPALVLRGRPPATRGRGRARRARARRVARARVRARGCARGASPHS